MIGTFVCTCPDGFRKSGLEDECEDVDECGAAPELCGPGQCLNTVGGYQCDCPAGYVASEDGRLCEDNRRGLCYQRSVRGRCEAAGGRSPVKMVDCCCTMGVAWGDQCTPCPRRGSRDYYQLCSDQGLGPLGRDIDECATMPDLCDNGLCINTLGSFRCSCDRGFTPDIARTSCLDVNECAEEPGPCEHECFNTFGSYKCRCPPGYQLNRDGRTCRDIDECSSGGHICQHDCVNTEGSYVCMCPPGYKQYGDRCLDIDECVEQQGLCPAPGTCKNTDGSFRCVCPRGHKLDETGTFCVDTNSQGGSGGCSSSGQSSYKCGCPDGFQLHLYFNQCVDKDECAEPDNPCGNSQCINTIGSYTCGCPR